MGQYFKALCLDKKQCLYSWDFENGAKLMEHSWRGNNYVEIVVNHLAPGGPWHKKRLVWAGDYADEGKFLDIKFSKKDIEKLSNELVNVLDMPQEEMLSHYNLYNVASICFNRVKPVITEEPSAISYNVFVNHSKKEFFEFDKRSDTLDKLGDDDEWLVHPLPLLVCDGNGRGGGDYCGSDPEELVGHWAGDIISTELTRPKGFTQIYPSFREE